MLQKKVAVIITHPIQYYSPLFRLLTLRGNVLLKVFYTWEEGAAHFDKGFGKKFEWDIPLLEGYDHTFVSNSGNMGKDFWSVTNPGLENEIDKWDPDAVLVYGWNYRSHLRAMRKYKARKTVLFRGDSTLLDKKPGIKSAIRKPFLRWVYSHVDLGLYVGTNNKNYFLRYGLNNDQLCFVPHSIDNARFMHEDEAQKKESERLLKSLGITDDAVRVLFVGKLLQKKNPYLLFEAFIKSDRKHMRLIVVGNGELEEELKAKAQGHSNIHFLPFQNQSSMPAVYRIGDIFCLPSQGPGETWGLAVNEAMACGRAVVVSDKVGCAIDLVKDGVNGYIFKSGDGGELANCLGLMCDRKKLAQMGRESLNIIQKFSFEKQIDALEDVIINRIKHR